MCHPWSALVLAPVGLGALALFLLAPQTCEALVARQERLLTKRMATFTVDDPEVLLLGRETIYREGEQIGCWE